jgi:cell division protein FtsI (penicillin-binding protein 3)/stage V sporulation protein D (sporulation-specific penicillin-binding protein)
MLAACGLLLAAVLARGVQLQVFDHDQYARAAASEHTEEIVLHATRGAIVDRNGSPLAISEHAVTVGAYVPLPDATAQTVAREVGNALNVSPATIYQRLVGVPTAHIDLARQVDPGIASKLEALKLAPLTFVPEEKRVYVVDSLALPIIGTTNIDGVGIAGVEESYNKVLHGTDGSERFDQSAAGDTTSPIVLAAPHNGAQIQLAIDSQLQGTMEQTVARTLHKTRAAHVIALSLDVRTGGILAMASAPGPVAATTYADVPANQVDLLRLRGLADSYEPGSTFKTVTVAAGLQRGVITPKTKFEVPGCLHLFDRWICDAEPHGLERLSVTDILRVSSNVGAVRIAYDKLSGPGPADHGLYFAPYVSGFGFGRPTGVDLPGESAGNVPPYRTWSGTSIGNIPFGQGLAVTPIQLASFYAMVANGGVWTQPHVVAGVGDAPVSPRRITMLRPGVAKELTRMLEQVVTPEGTGEKAAVQGYTVAGKTGTTQKVVNGTYSKTDFVASFVGFAPAQAPRVVTLVIVDDPTRGSHFGGSAAAPVFSQLMSQALHVLGVPRS